MMTEQEIINKIEEAFNRLGDSTNLTTIPSLSGKLFELYSLVDVIENLKGREFDLTIVPHDGYVKFASGPSKIDRNKFSYIKLQKDNKKYELWMDIEFIGISGKNISGFDAKVFRANFVHELDIAILKANIPDGKRPIYNEVYLAAECKDTQNFEKSILKQILGIRRELSFLINGVKENAITGSSINQNPPTEFWIYSSNSSVNNLQHVGNFWGLKFKHLNIERH